MNAFVVIALFAAGLAHAQCTGTGSEYFDVGRLTNYVSYYDVRPECLFDFLN